MEDKNGRAETFSSSLVVDIWVLYLHISMAARKGMLVCALSGREACRPTPPFPCGDSTDYVEYTQQRVCLVVAQCCSLYSE